MVNFIGKSFLVLVVILSIAQFALAVDSTTISNATFSIVSSLRAGETAGTTNAPDAGNITKLGVDITVNTKRWAGYIGNVTGSMKLGSGSSDLFVFNALSQDRFKGVFAVVAQSFNFAGAIAADEKVFDTKWGFGAAADNASQVFRETASRFGVTAPIARMNTRNTEGNVTNNRTLDTALLMDSAAPSQTDYAFAGSIANSTVLRSYDNLSIVDFEMIVATNDSDGDGDPDGDTTYYFYLQIT